MKTNLQNKWRLPTIDEFENVLNLNVEKIPNLKESPYWSSFEGYYYVAWYFNFYSVRAYYYYFNKSYTAQVRAVRDVSSDSTNSINSIIIGNLEVQNEDLGSMNYFDAVDAVEKLNNNKKH